MQAVFDGLALWHVLEEQPPALADTGGLVVRVVGVTDRRVAAEDPPAAVHCDRSLAEVTSRQQVADERTLILRLILQRGSPEIRECWRVLGVDDQLPVQCHVSGYTGLYRHREARARQKTPRLTVRKSSEGASPDGSGVTSKRPRPVRCRAWCATVPGPRMTARCCSPIRGDASGPQQRWTAAISSGASSYALHSRTMGSSPRTSRR